MRRRGNKEKKTSEKKVGKKKKENGDRDIAQTIRKITKDKESERRSSRQRTKKHQDNKNRWKT